MDDPGHRHLCHLAGFIRCLRDAQPRHRLGRFPAIAHLDGLVDGPGAARLKGVLSVPQENAEIEPALRVRVNPPFRGSLQRTPLVPV